MTIKHSLLTGSALHEPKAIAAAAANRVYLSDGASSGDWLQLPVVTGLSPTGFTQSQIIRVNSAGTAFEAVDQTNCLTSEFDDIQAATSHWIAFGCKSEIVRVSSVIDTSFTGSDTTLTFKIGATPLTNGVITITQSGSAAGDVDFAIPTANNIIQVGEALEIVSNGGASTAVSATVTVTRKLLA